VNSLYNENALNFSYFLFYFIIMFCVRQLWVLEVIGCVWYCVCNCVLSNFEFFLLKLNAVCTFWIVLMCWCQKWFLKNKKTSFACISARKAIWKATATTLPNTLIVIELTLGMSLRHEVFKLICESWSIIYLFIYLYIYIFIETMLFLYKNYESKIFNWLNWRSSKSNR